MNDNGIKRIVGPTILLRSGKYFDFENPEACEIDVNDIATALSHICRFTGHCHSFYSVAEHSVHCSYLVPREDAFAALMHDAVEAVVGDMSRPLKSMLPEYKAIERRCEAAILARFGLSIDMPHSVKLADIQMLAIEQVQAMQSPDEWPGVTGAIDPFSRTLEFWTPEIAHSMFVRRYYDLLSCTDIAAQNEDH